MFIHLFEQNKLHVEYNYLVITQIKVEPLGSVNRQIMAAPNLHFRPPNGKHRPAALTNMKQDNAD
jgi:hypothetical protein